MGFEAKFLCDKCKRNGKYNPGTRRSFCDTCYYGSHFDDTATTTEVKEMLNKIYGVRSREVDSIPEIDIKFKNGISVDLTTPKKHRDGRDAFVYSIDELSFQNTPTLRISPLLAPNIRPEFISKVVFNDPATIVFWADGTKTVVKAVDEPFDKEKGLAMAICKKIFGNKGNYFNVIKEWTEKED
jgi:hypothetical protein